MWSGGVVRPGGSWLHSTSAAACLLRRRLNTNQLQRRKNDNGRTMCHPAVLRTFRTPWVRWWPQNGRGPSLKRPFWLKTSRFAPTYAKKDRNADHDFPLRGRVPADTAPRAPRAFRHHTKLVRRDSYHPSPPRHVQHAPAPIARRHDLTLPAPSNAAVLGSARLRCLLRAVLLVS